jgi:hypothetical protein
MLWNEFNLTYKGNVKQKGQNKINYNQTTEKPLQRITKYIYCSSIQSETRNQRG